MRTTHHIAMPIVRTAASGQLWRAIAALVTVVAITLGCSDRRAHRPAEDERSPLVQQKEAKAEIAKLTARAKALDDRGRSAEAVTTAKKALAVAEVAFGADHPIVANCLDDLAGRHILSSEFTNAVPLYLRSLAITEKAYGQFSMNSAQALRWLTFHYITRASGLIYEAEDRKLAGELPKPGTQDEARRFYALAEATCKRSLAIYEIQRSKYEKLGDVNKLRGFSGMFVDSERYELANIYRKTGRTELAEATERLIPADVLALLRQADKMPEIE